MKKVIITGHGGQLATELSLTAPSTMHIVSFSSKQLDITNRESVRDTLCNEKPDLIINAAAYTAVDKAESDVEAAYAVNALGSENLAIVCQELSTKLIHISTDFVFDGSKTTPYQVDDETNPLSVYGASKLAGEEKIAAILGGNATIIRTAWVYSVHGNNFVKTMLRLMQEKEQLGVVWDQVGTPTWAKGLAEMIWRLVEQSGSSFCADYRSEKPVLLHWTDAGVASWYDFAIAIQELAIEKGLLAKAIPVIPIPASHYPTPAKRPSFSVIDKTAAETASCGRALHWRQQLSTMLEEMKTIN
ncbi:dTDP-4-dehydrorhamnose reductase [Photobacterium sp. TLY01]|uniref:dTDP-4-dehydrorhamnose reductase n=1 Tax=Photobacterium sp. TLY01 TaxID=2907534 RepID=UPI001F29A19E|nr:dTDP-4-dehydrorhamnose reductase [Photobacterium sp. TLY01]UIP27215.1 dTDP-4-dehydrorhamnose reductase [Photobacterium sp. TLY01]